MEQDRCGLQARLLELTHDAVFAWRLSDGSISYWNKGAECTYGYTANQAMGQNIHRLLTTDFLGQRAAIEADLRTKGHWSGSLKYTCQDGAPIYADSRMVTQASGEGELTVLETSRDVTDRVEMEKSLRINEERFRSFVMATAQAVAIADPNGEIIQDSPSWRAFTGQSYEELKGTGWAAVVHPDDIKRVQVRLKQSTTHGSCFEVECRIRRADGQYRWAHLRSVAILNADGSVREWVAAITDITDKKLAQQAISASEERLHFALDAGAMITWDWNLVTNLVKRTGPAHTLFGLGDSSAEEFLAPVDSRDRDWLMSAIDAAKRGAAPLDAEFRMIGANGRVSWIQAKGQLRHDQATGEPYLTGVALNVTKRRRAEERLKLLDAIAESTRSISDPDFIVSHTTRLLGEHLDASRCSYLDRGEDGRFQLYREWTGETVPHAPTTLAEQTLAALANEELRNSQSVVVRDLGCERYQGVGKGTVDALGSRAFIACPIHQRRRTVGLLVVHQNKPRNWTAGEVYIVEQVAERCWFHLDRVRTTEALRHNEAHLSALVEQSAVGIVEMELSGCIVRVNERCRQLLGVERAEILGKRLHDFIHPQDRTHSAELFENAVRQTRSFTLEQRFQRPDGSTVWVSTSVSVVCMAQDKPISCVLAILQDVTERKQAEEQLSEMASRLQLTLESAEIGDWDLDLSTNTSHRSARHDRCFGYTEPVASWGFDEFIAHVHPDDRDRVAQQFYAAASKCQEWHFECRVIWPDQSTHWIAAHGSFYQRGDEPVKLNGVVFDITGRKNYEQSLRRSECLALQSAREAEAERRRLNAVLEAVPIGIAVVDVKGAVSQANPALWRLWGEHHPTPASFEDYAKWNAWWADGSERHGQRLQPGDWLAERALRGEQIVPDIIEIESYETPPVRRIVLRSAAPIRDNEGNTIGAVAALMDITDRMRAEEALKEAGRRKDEFLAMLAHELRNPLAPIGAAADLLRLAHSDASRVQKASAIISRQVRHMSSLVDDLLDVSRVTRGFVTLEKVKLDAKRVVAEAVEQVRPMIERRGHQLVMHTPPQSAFVLADHKRLVQVMTNLLNNAAKYTPEGGVIGLGVEVFDGQVRLSVVDNGIGMTSDLLEGAFELFVQAERSSDRSQGGLGIGLALVRSLVEMHGGSVHAYSEGLGKGSKFVVCLPQLREDEQEAAPSLSAGEASRPGPQHKILIVDDNADAAQALAMFCEALGHQVMVEHCSKKALERAITEVPDTCLLDIGLPDMDGNELARRLRAQPETAQAMLVAVTGYGQEQDRCTALQAGFDHHLVKPLNMAKLAAVLSGGTAH